MKFFKQETHDAYCRKREKYTNTCITQFRKDLLLLVYIYIWDSAPVTVKVAAKFRWWQHCCLVAVAAAVVRPLLLFTVCDSNMSLKVNNLEISVKEHTGTV